jgi:hypothetical protein
VNEFFKQLDQQPWHEGLVAFNAYGETDKADLIRPGERVWSWGHKSCDAATEAIWRDMSDGLLSYSDRPREVAYRTSAGWRWAVAIRNR